MIIRHNIDSHVNDKLFEKILSSKYDYILGSKRINVRYKQLTNKKKQILNWNSKKKRMKINRTEKQKNQRVEVNQIMKKKI